jgi:hypothetical protein
MMDCRANILLLLLEKLCLHSLHKRRYHLDAILLLRSIVASNPALPSWKMLVFVFLLAMLGTSQNLAFVLLLGAPMLRKWWVKISTYICNRSGFC